MSTLFAALDGDKEAILASDSALSILDGEDTQQIPGFFKVFPLGPDVLFGAIGSYRTVIDIVRQLSASKKRLKPSEVAKKAAAWCSDLHGQSRLHMAIVGREDGGFVYHELEGHDFEELNEERFAEPLTKALDGLEDREAPYRITTTRSAVGKQYAWTIPGASFANHHLDEAARKGFPLRKAAPLVIRAVAEASGHQGHDANVEIWRLGKKGAPKITYASKVDEAS